MYDNVHLGKIHDEHDQVAFMLSYTDPADDPAAASSGGYRQHGTRRAGVSRHHTAVLLHHSRPPIAPSDTCHCPEYTARLPARATSNQLAMHREQLSHAMLTHAQ